MSMEKRIMIGIPVNRWLSPKFSISLAKATNYLMANGYTVDIHYDNGSVISTQRNKIIKAAATEEMNLLFIDSDMVYDETSVDALISCVELGDIVSGLFFMRRFPFKAAVFSEDLVDTEGVYRGMLYTKMPTYPFECAATGCAFTLIKLDAIQVILARHPYPFNNYELPNGDVLGEDLSFMHRCKLAGLTVVCDPSAEVGHITERIVYSADHVAALELIEENAKGEAENES